MFSFRVPTVGVLVSIDCIYHISGVSKFRFSIHLAIYMFELLSRSPHISMKTLRAITSGENVFSVFNCRALIFLLGRQTTFGEAISIFDIHLLYVDRFFSSIVFSRKAVKLM